MVIYKMPSDLRDSDPNIRRYTDNEIIVSYPHPEDVHIKKAVYIKTQQAGKPMANWVAFSPEYLEEFITRLQFLQAWLNDPELRKEHPTL